MFLKMQQFSASRFCNQVIHPNKIIRYLKAYHVIIWLFGEDMTDIKANPTGILLSVNKTRPTSAFH